MSGLRTLVLNSSYMPISLFPIHTIMAEEAVTRVLNGTCHAVFEYDRKIQTPNLIMNWPSVIARNKSEKTKEKVNLRPESLYYRDHGICQYCEKPLYLHEMTYDHVWPKSKGGKLEWDNVVAACPSCNLKKGDNKPIGQWKPKRAPYKPTYYELLNARRRFPVVVDDINWIPFLGDWEGQVNVRAAA